MHKKTQNIKYKKTDKVQFKSFRKTLNCVTYCMRLNIVYFQPCNYYQQLSLTVIAENNCRYGK